MTNLGENLTNYPNLTVFSDISEKKLLEQLIQIRLPHKIVSIYASGSRHFAWVSLTRPIKKVTKGE